MSAAIPKVRSTVPAKSSAVKATTGRKVQSKDNKPNGDAPNIEKGSGKRVQNVPVKPEVKSPSKAKSASSNHKGSGEPKTVYKNTGVPLLQRLFIDGLERNENTSLAAIQENAAISPYICLRAAAYFICENERCQTKRWSSNRAWITIDLARPGVLRRYKQKCACCGQSSWPRIFNLEEFVEHVIEIYLSRAEHRRHPSSSTKNAPARNGGGPNKNHRQELCEKCGYGKRDCALGNSYRFNAESN